MKEDLAQSCPLIWAKLANNETLSGGVTYCASCTAPRELREGASDRTEGMASAECALREGKDDEGEPTRGEEDRTTEERGGREREREKGRGEVEEGRNWAKRWLCRAV